jgi:hypothetical protein
MWKNPPPFDTVFNPLLKPGPIPSSMRRVVFGRSKSDTDPDTHTDARG